MPSADEESRNTLEVIGGMINSAQAPEKREGAPKGKVKGITNAKFPVYRSNRGSWAIQEGGDTSDGVQG